MLIKKSELKEIWKSLGKRKLDELKQEIIAILKKQEEKDYKKAIEQFSKEEKKYKYLEKSISGEWIEKAGYGIGTVRVWKGKKYKKIAPGKWARMYEKEGRGINIAVGHLIAKVKKIDDIEELMNFVMQNKQRFQDENGMDLPILDKIRAEVDKQSGKIESKGKSENTEKKDLKPNKYDKATIQKMGSKYYVYTEEGGREVEKFNTKKEAEDYIKRQRLIQNEKKLKGEDGYSKLLDKLNESTENKDEKYTDNAKFVKEVKGDVWEEWNTDPNKFAVIYDKNTGKSKGLRMTQDIVDIINSVVEPSVLDWQDNVAEKVHEKYPEIKESYIKENIKQIRMGYRNGSQEKIQILNKESESEKHQNRSEAMKGNKNAYKGDPKEVAKYINGKTTKDSERKELLNEALNDRYGTDKKDPFYSIGDLYSKVKQLTPHSDKWYDAINNYDEASEIYRMVIGDNKLDYYNDEIEKERMKPNYKKEELPKKEETNIDNDFNKMIARIKNDYPNMPKEAEESLKEEYKRMGISKKNWIEYREKLFKNKEEEKKREEQRKQEKNNEKEEKINKYVKHIKNQLGIGDVGDSLYKKEEYVSILNDTIQKYGKKSIMGIAAQRIIDNMKESEPEKREEKQQNQMTPKQQKTFDDFEKKAIKKASNSDQGKRFAKHNYNIDGEDWTITTDGRVMLCSREKFEEPTKTDKITNMDKVFVINGQKESAIPDGIDAIIKAAPKTVVTGKDYNGKEKKEFSIIKLGDRYFNTDYLKTVQNFLGPLSNVKMQVIPGDNKSRVKFESGNKAVVLLPIEISDELENRIINTNDIKKSLEDIIMFCNDFEDEVIEEINNESLFSDYSAENPELFNSIAFKVEEVLNECGICGL